MRFLWSFLILTLRQPGVAARSILLRPFPDEAIWTGLFLSVILNALMVGVLGSILPATHPLSIYCQPAEYPGLSLMLSVVRTVLFVGILTYSGRFLGGTARFKSVLSLMVWIELIQPIVMSFAIVILLMLPEVGSLIVLIVGVVLLFVLLNFVNEAHGFASLWRSFAVVLMASIIMLFAMLLLVGLIGPANLGLI